MIVRRYVVKEMPEAVLLIRKELGKEAVILSTRKVYVKKWLGFLRARRIEVMAAAGGDVSTKKPASESPRVRSIRAQNQSDEFRPMIVAVQAASEPPLEPHGLEKASLDKTPSNVSETQVSSTPLFNQGHTGFTELHREIMQLREFIADTVAGNQATHAIHMQPYSNTLMDELLQQGFSHAYAKTLIAEYQKKATEPTARPSWEVAKQGIAKIVMKQLSEIQEPRPIDSESRVILFLGPTGVGKTTTIAKIAALNVLSGKRKVGLLTTDTFRIAAIEQLRTYASILNVPIGVFSRITETVDAFATQNDRDLILIDTAGRNYRDGLYVDEMAHLCEQIPVDETYLVLPMTGKATDLLELSKAFDAVKFDKFLFTKMDETSTFGPVVEVLAQYRRPLSYITTGQSVPDDLEIASLQQIVQRAFGEEAL